MTSVLDVTLEDLVAKLAATWDTKAIAAALDVPHDRLVEVLRMQLAPRKLWKTKEAAAICGMPYRTFMEVLRRGELPTVREGRYCLIPDAALNEWINAKSTPARKGPLAISA